MSTVIIYASYHHLNTHKIAQAMGEELSAELLNFAEADQDRIITADIVGFGSGVYLGKFHQGLIRLIEELPAVEDRPAFVFSTSGVGQMPIFNRAHRHIKARLKEKGFKIVGEFDCRGFDTYGPLKFFGGMHKDRPNDRDIDQARKFARGLPNR